MKLLFAILLLGAGGLIAENDSDGIRASVREHKKDGQVIRRTEFVHRGDDLIVTTIEYLLPETRKRSLRFYRVDGAIVMSEIDDNGDGTFETFVLYKTGSSAMDVFERGDGNAVKPVSSRRLEHYKGQLREMEEFFDTADDAESAAKRIEKARKPKTSP